MMARLKDTGEIIDLAEEGIISHDGRRFCWYQVELIPEPIDECKPSIPSDIDEAAEEYALDVKAKPFGDLVKETFKAGAQWRDAQIPKLDSLDEVAIPESKMSEWMKYGPHTNYPWCSVPDAIKITAENFFALGKQTGAKWMAGQGYTVDGIVICDKELTRGYKDIVMSIPDELKVDDKVTLQIRKRQ